MSTILPHQHPQLAILSERTARCDGLPRWGATITLETGSGAISVVRIRTAHPTKLNGSNSGTESTEIAPDEWVAGSPVAGVGLHMTASGLEPLETSCEASDDVTGRGCCGRHDRHQIRDRRLVGDQ